MTKNMGKTDKNYPTHCRNCYCNFDFGRHIIRRLGVDFGYYRGGLCSDERDLFLPAVYDLRHLDRTKGRKERREEISKSELLASIFLYFVQDSGFRPVQLQG